MKLYKYISIDDNDVDAVIESILQDNLIKFTQAKYFNDQFELKPHIQKIANNIDELKRMLNSKVPEEYGELYKKSGMFQIKFNNITLDVNDKTLKDVMNSQRCKKLINNKLNKEMSNKIGLISLTTKKNNLLMWAHYASSHKGFVIQFDHKNDFFKTRTYLNKENIENEIYLQKVNYDKDRPSECLYTLDKQSTLFTKSKEWKYEKEYRMIMPLEKIGLNEKSLYLEKFPANMIKAIYLGCNMKKRNKDTIISIIKDKEILKNVQVYDSHISDKYYKLNFKRIL